MSCTPQIAPEGRTFNPEVPGFKPIPVGRTFTVDEVRQIPEKYTTTEILIAAHGFPGTARYTFDTLSTLADDGAAVLRPVWRNSDQAGRWLREDLIAGDFEPLGAVASHEAAGNPHPQYTTDAEATSIAEGEVADHEALSDPHAAAGYVKDDGSRPMAADLDMDGNEVVNAAAPTTPQALATKAYVDGKALWGENPKTTDETVSSSTALQDDDDLQFPMEANTKYSFEMEVFYSTDPAADFKFRHTGPAAPDYVHITRETFAPGASSMATRIDNAYSAADVVMTDVGGDTQGYVRLKGTIHNGVNAGSFKFQWAQNAGSTNPTKVKAGSWVKWRPS